MIKSGTVIAHLFKDKCHQSRVLKLTEFLYPWVQEARRQDNEHSVFLARNILCFG